MTILDDLRNKRGIPTPIEACILLAGESTIAQKAAAELVSLRARLEALEAAEQFHPRAMKLIRKKKNFLVVAEDEPYFETVYHEIKLHELLRGTWTEDDERRYLAALDGTR